MIVSCRDERGIKDLRTFNSGIQLAKLVQCYQLLILFIAHEVAYCSVLIRVLYPSALPLVPLFSKLEMLSSIYLIAHFFIFHPRREESSENPGTEYQAKE